MANNVIIDPMDTFNVEDFEGPRGPVEERGEVVNFLPGQQKFMESIAPELLYSGAWGAGKSYVGCQKAYFLSMKYPGNRGLICRKAFAHLRYSTMITFFEQVCPKNAYAKNGFNKSEHLLTLRNGSKIWFLGLEDFNKIGSMELAWIFADEAIEFGEEEWEMFGSRLRYKGIPFYQLFGATNPGAPSHHLYSRFYKSGRDDVEYVESSTLENTFNPQQYIDRMNRVTGKMRERFVEGKWITFEGQIYDTWDPDRHHIPGFPIPPEWPRYRAVDFGFNNPFVCHWWAMDPKPSPVDGENDWHLYREIYMSHRTIIDHAEDILRYSKGEYIIDSTADHDAGDRAVLENYGISTVPARKEVNAGLSHVYDRISNNHVFIHQNCTVETDRELAYKKKPASTAEEIISYQWERRLSAKAYIMKDEPDKPAKKDDHGMDAMRYHHFTIEGQFAPPATVRYGLKREIEDPELAYSGTRMPNRSVSDWMRLAPIATMGSSTKRNWSKMR